LTINCLHREYVIRDVTLFTALFVNIVFNEEDNILCT